MAKKKKSQPKPKGDRAGGPPTGPVRALSLHAHYRCGNTGVCCRADWTLPVDPVAHRKIGKALRDGALAPPVEGPLTATELMPPPPVPVPGAKGVFARCEDHACVFLDVEGGTLCSVHRDLGAEALPPVCRLFPRLCVLRPHETAITLSHFCPTAARGLFDFGGEIEIVTDPPAFPRGEPYAGLDTRTHKPPLLREGTLMDWDAHAVWERHCVETLGRAGESASAALCHLISCAEALRAWDEQGPALRSFVERTLAGVSVSAESGPLDMETAVGLFAQMLGRMGGRRRDYAAVHDALEGRYRAGGAALLGEDFAQWVQPQWTEFDAPVRRHLAARLFANHCAHQGNGVFAGLGVAVWALAALRVHAAILCAAAGRALDRDLALEAVRMTDFLMLHALPRAALVETVNAAEGMGAGALRAAARG